MIFDHLGRAAAVLMLVPALAVAAAAPAAAGTPEPTALAVAQALVDAFGPGAVVDTNCQSTARTPVAYRTDRIILRPPPSMTTTTAVNRVAAALQDEMGAGTFKIGTPETLAWDTAFAAGPSLAAAEESSIWRVVSVPVDSLSEEDVPVVKVARRLRADDLPASPDTLLTPSDGPLGVWPEGGPEPTDGPGTPRKGLGAGTTVAVYDVGVTGAGQASLPPKLTQLTSGDVENPDRNGDGFADLYYSVHLNAIAGIFATIVPDATVLGVRITGTNGVATDFSAAKRMVNTLRDAADVVFPDVIVNSFGTPVCEVGPPEPGADMVPLGLQMVAEGIDQRRQGVVVAAAGNRGTDKPFYPAAFDSSLASVISVGALDATTDDDGDPWTSASRSAKPASFSNYGPWVTVGAGRETGDVSTRSASPTRSTASRSTGTRKSTTGPRSPRRSWSGISSNRSPAPVRHRWRRGTRFVESGRTCSAAIGSGVAVALPSMADTSTTEADPRLPTMC